MRRMLVVATAFVALFVSSSGGQQVDGQKVLELFLAQKQTPVTQCVSVRQMRAGAVGFSASMEVETRQDNKTFSYTVVHEEGSEVIRDSVMRPILEVEKALTEGDDGSGFSNGGYLFGPVKSTKEGLWRMAVVSLPKNNPLTDNMLFLNNLGKLVRSTGKLAKNPHFFIRGVRLEFTYAEVSGIRMPIHLSVTSKIFLAFIPLSGTLEMKYIYRSINGVEVEEIK